MLANILSRFPALSRCTLRWFKHVLAGFRPEGIVEFVAKVRTLSPCLFEFPYSH